MIILQSSRQGEFFYYTNLSEQLEKTLSIHIVYFLRGQNFNLSLSYDLFC